MSDVTRILSAIGNGDENAARELMPLVYQELRKLAASRLSKEKPSQSWQPTMLVHEAYLRLVDGGQPQQWNGRGHFFAAAAEAMRRILVDNARRKQTLKHGAKMQRIGLQLVDPATNDASLDILALDEALSEFEEQWPDKAKLVKLRYFAGLTIPEASQAMEISTATAERYWRFARVWLHARLHTDD